MSSSFPSLPRFPGLAGSPEADSWETDPRHRTNIRRKTARKRALLEPYVEGSVLDIGAAGGAAGFVTDEFWLHGWLDEHADSVVGIDIDRDGVAEAAAAGYDFRRASAETFDLDETFDVVVAANVIEHLTNPGSMVRRAREHLAPDGRLLVTTPRTHLAWNLLRELLSDEGIEPHPEHTMWFCRATLTELLSREGFEVERYETWGFDRVGMSTKDAAWRRVERTLSRVPGLDDIDHVQQFVVATPASDDARDGLR